MSREDLSKALVESLNEVASLLDYAHSVSVREQNGLVKNNAEEITICSKIQDEILRRITESDQRAAAISTQIADAAGIDSANADINSISNAAGHPYTASITGIIDQIASSARMLKRQNIINKKLIENGLEIVAYSFRAMATDNSPRPYSKDANVKEPDKPMIISLDMRV